MRQVVWLLFYLSLCLSAQAVDKVRTWTSIDGRTMQAQFVREVDGDVTFLKDGKPITLPLDRLSESDRQLIRDLDAGKKSADDSASDDAASTRPLEAAEAAAPAVADPRRPPPAKKEIVVANRIWTDPRGVQTTAKFVRIVGRNVVLLRGNRTVIFPFDALTSVDQDYVRELLISRGDEALIPPPIAVAGEPAGPSTAPADNLPASPPAASEASAADQDLSAARGNTPFFQERRARDEELRQEQSQYAAEPPPRPSGEEQQRIENLPAAGRASVSSSRTTTTLDPEAAKEVRGAIIIVVVAVGVLGTVALIVVIAIAIAGVNTNRQRRYSS